VRLKLGRFVSSRRSKWEVRWNEKAAYFRLILKLCLRERKADVVQWSKQNSAFLFTAELLKSNNVHFCIILFHVVGLLYSIRQPNSLHTISRPLKQYAMRLFYLYKDLSSG
jgi:hypothetical protein